MNDYSRRNNEMMKINIKSTKNNRGMTTGGWITYETKYYESNESKEKLADIYSIYRLVKMFYGCYIG